jgi:hypothetical protein
MDLSAIAERLRQEAEARPLTLPVRRRVDERHHVETPDGLNVWFTIQVAHSSRIHDVVFERSDRMPSNDECQAWLRLLIPGHEAQESPGLPGSHTRRFEFFEGDPRAGAPLA